MIHIELGMFPEGVFGKQSRQYALSKRRRAVFERISIDKRQVVQHNRPVLDLKQGCHRATIALGHLATPCRAPRRDNIGRCEEERQNILTCE